MVQIYGGQVVTILNFIIFIYLIKNKYKII
jgi:hypothetical protein